MKRRKQAKPCPHCKRSAQSCWLMPCLDLQLALDSIEHGVSSSADAVNKWARAVRAPFTVEPKS
jgi:hypothetical protein